MVKELYKQAEQKMGKALEALEHELGTLRTGRASVSILEPVKVKAYESEMPLKQVASISVPDPRTILIQPWDKTLLPNVEKAILAAPLGLNPQNDGTVIRIAIPQLTEERRKELAKIAHQMAEQGKVAVRNIRRHIMDEIKTLEKDHKISEDERYRAGEKVQEITDTYIKEIDEALKAKEDEIMEV